MSDVRNLHPEDVSSTGWFCPSIIRVWAHMTFWSTTTKGVELSLQPAVQADRTQQDSWSCSAAAVTLSFQQG